MYAQTCPLKEQLLYSNLPIIQSKKLSLSPSFRHGFCDSVKRVSNPRISLRYNCRVVGMRRAMLQEEQQSKEDGAHDDSYYMTRCVELATKAVGCTSPNPMVGCVILRDGKIVGEGFHPKAGQPHAEVFALRDAGNLAENGTAYVSLEPCNHYGRTPPCTEALIKAKVKKVVIGMVDPNPIVASTGVQKLQDAGIQVVVGVEEELCKKLNEAYIHRMLTQKPFVTIRYSISVNGCPSDNLGEKALQCGGYYSKLLQEYDAVILSSTSLKEKPPILLSNEPGANQPLHIVVSKGSNSQIQLPDYTSKVIIFTQSETEVEQETGQKGIETVCCEKISLAAILEHCYCQGLCSVLLDLRGKYEDFDDILEEGLEQNLLQKVVIEVLPFWSGGEEKVLKHLGRKIRLKNLTSRTLGESILLEGYFNEL